MCVGPANKFGPRCLLTETVCQTNSSICRNGGRCIAITDFMVSNQGFECICPTGFTGDRCEIAANELILSFGKNVATTSQVFIHFIEVVNRLEPIEFTVRTTTFKTILPEQDSVIIDWSVPFHFVR